MNNIQIYVHGENNREPKLIEVPEDISVREIIEKYTQAFGNSGQPHEIILFIENEHEPKHYDHRGFKKRMHVHCHRCQQIAVSIVYNGDDKEFHFPPAATTKTIMKKVIAEFGINESDAGDYLLKTDDKTILQPGDHIGSFASHAHCRVKLFLTATKPVQG